MTLRSISQAIDKFCEKHRKFGVPGLMKYIVFITGAVFIINLVDAGNTLPVLFAFSPELILQAQVWRLITWVFLPLATNPFFALIMLFFYYFMGTSLEREWGTAKFNIFYFFGVSINIIYGFIMWIIPGTGAVWLDPHFLNLSMFFAFAVLFPDFQVRLMLIIPIKVKWMALINAFFFFYMFGAGIMAGMFVEAFLPFVAILNFFLFCGYDLISRLRPALNRPRRHSGSSNVIKFKKVSRVGKSSSSSQTYRHKCAVCGKTDTDYPDLEFRYCSRCTGYHCFCLEHINKHIHFK
jgi:hypothetical protein